jgi:hypothetical protein
MSIESVDTPIEIIALWRRLDQPHWLDHCHLRGTKLGWSLEGTLVGVLDGQPLRAQYRVNVDRLWRTRMAGVTVWTGTEQQGFRLGRSDEGIWTAFTTGAELSALTGLTDVDISLTPATNTLPIRRLGLEVGESAETTAVWIRPDLNLEPLPQRYTRTAESTYLYESGENFDRFRAEISVDEHGVVAAYPPIWERLAAAEGVGES